MYDWLVIKTKLTLIEEATSLDVHHGYKVRKAAFDIASQAKPESSDAERAAAKQALMALLERLPSPTDSSALISLMTAVEYLLMGETSFEEADQKHIGSLVIQGLCSNALTHSSACAVLRWLKESDTSFIDASSLEIAARLISDEELASELSA